jgi:uncharacterized protein (TIGR00725 family)
MLGKQVTICVIGSHSQDWLEYADPLGKMLAEEGFNLITGAGGGVMCSVSKSFSSITGRAGKVIGIVPTIDYHGEKLDRETYSNVYIDIPILVPLDNKAMSDTMPYSRNHVNIMSADAVVVLPGQHGTHNEVSLALMYEKPVILFGETSSFLAFPDAPYRAENLEEVKDFLRKKT